MESQEYDRKIAEMYSAGELSPRGGIGGSEHCVAVISRRARILYIYKSKRKLK